MESFKSQRSALGYSIKPESVLASSDRGGVIVRLWQQEAATPVLVSQASAGALVQYRWRSVAVSDEEKQPLAFIKYIFILYKLY